ncbi:LOW QUALITY PROTEIN: nuclear receptor subfamily 0 group B member 2-like [Scyliorhinus canicula]|uniref:LOW QUALITY PROTEIN: nuclear receptor subfamily 0 group B member 2-like n=1 Tax=Scyliorhinus canicula TaxID=7830 RepID=UPI0018F309E2|nr:LOW QUALITY PROTEIN: nuclear receptor subfamily 0 group B member 2-like [Scyliorhinus canicula]
MACVDVLLDKCHCATGKRQSAILYTILSQQGDLKDCGESSHHSCSSEARRTVRLKTPQVTCQAVSDVLVKTVRFIRNLPSFHHLPRADQLLLLESCWLPLFLLGLAQERVSFEVIETPGYSMLRRILLNGPGLIKTREEERRQPTLAGVQRIKMCLNKFWGLRLNSKEYAYLKGAVLFNPDLPGLGAPAYIEGLQREAQRALHQLLVPLPPRESSRFARILLTVSALKTISTSLITELFFRPVIGTGSMEELLLDMLYTQ